MLDVQSFTKIYQGAHGPVQAVRELSFQATAGEFLAIQGPSGCGKSTLLLACGGLLHPTTGKILLQGQDLYALSGEARAKLRATQIGFVFQQFHLIPYLSVLDNVLSATLGSPLVDARSRAFELIERFGLSPRLHHVPAELSTGERQRTALARALLHRPKLLLADEPTGNLDSANADLVLRSLEDFANGGGTVLLVTHDPTAAARAQRSLHLVK
jgi:ABC-type lipoprotein export system ATPase subunit